MVELLMNLLLIFSFFTGSSINHGLIFSILHRHQCSTKLFSIDIPMNEFSSMKKEINFHEWITIISKQKKKPQRIVKHKQDIFYCFHNELKSQKK